MVDIADLTVSEARNICLRELWNSLGVAQPAIKFQAFDFAVQFREPNLDSQLAGDHRGPGRRTLEANQRGRIRSIFCTI